MHRTIMDPALLAVAEAMNIIRQAQQLGAPTRLQVKSDATIVTPTDKQVEQFLHDRLRGLPNVGTFIGEEGAASNGEGELTLMVDPLDGTRAFACGLATSTIIVAATHPERGVVLCVVGEPSTGRIWSATEEDPTELRVTHFRGNALHMTSPVSVRVWDGDLGPRSVVLMDVSHGFQRGERQILRDSAVRAIMHSVSEKAILLMPGSNGLHFAMVANGGTGMAGQITTAVGGPWDIAGALLVQQAGGYATGWKVVGERALESRDPRHIHDCDIVVSGNNEGTVEQLIDCLYT